MRTGVPAPIWSPLDVSRLKNIGGHSTSRKSVRVFGLNGKLFPRLVISIWEQTGIGEGYDGHFVSVAQKDDAGGWWRDRSIPSELLNLIPEMIAEVLEKRT